MSRTRKRASGDAEGSQQVTSSMTARHATRTGRQILRCPACGFTYESPIEVARASHLCPARDGARRVLKAI